MEKTPAGTSVGVADPYAHADRCDHLTDDGRCRFAVERSEADGAFAAARRAEDYACPVVADAGPDWSWSDCPHFRATTDGRACARCGLEERRDARSDARPLLEEHHLSYADADGEVSHEVTVALCRWCHAKVHGSWASLADDASPDPEAVAERERRRGDELSEMAFETAAERRVDREGESDGRGVGNGREGENDGDGKDDGDGEAHGDG